MVLICGRYEGVDERVSEHLADREMSIGDYVLSGGELGAAVIVDAVTRLIPGALGNEASSRQESFTDARCSEDGTAWPEFDLRFGRIARLSALHASSGVSRDAGAGSAGVRQPRRDSPLASAEQRWRRRCATGRTCWTGAELSDEDRNCWPGVAREDILETEGKDHDEPHHRKTAGKGQRTDIPAFVPGDTIRVHVKIKEGDKERLQAFEGVVIARSRGPQASFTVRKMSFGMAWSVSSP